jgi:hypothetical protein
MWKDMSPQPPQRREALPEPAESGFEIYDFFTPDVLRQQLEDISYLDQHALLDTLVPHRQLPTFDPAGYILAQRERISDDKVNVKTSYDLGVVFGRSLLDRALPKDLDHPVVSEFNDARKQLVDSYLQDANRLHSAGVAYYEEQLHPDLHRAIALFSQRCSVIMPHIMFDGEADVLRGCHDYVSVVALLEAPTEQSANRLLLQSLGRVGLGESNPPLTQTQG